MGIRTPLDAALGQWQLRQLAAGGPELWPQILEHANTDAALAEWIEARSQAPHTPLPSTPLPLTRPRPPAWLWWLSGGLALLLAGLATLAVWSIVTGPDAVLTAPRAQVAGELSAGASSVCAVSRGEVLCWGSGEVGQLGDGESGDGHTASVPRPVPLPGIAVGVSVGFQHACAVLEDGRAYCWGEGRHGQLGDDRATASAAPVLVASGLAWRQLSVGGFHTCGVTGDAALYCWGAGYDGQLGDGDGSWFGAPTAVRLDGRVASVSAGAASSCAVTEAGEVYCWGDGESGQLGDGLARTSALPVRVPLPEQATTVSVGHGHACAVDEEGLAYCWGDDARRQLGGTIAQHDSALQYGRSREALPVPVDVDRPLVGISAGYANTCGITYNGLAYCWGDASQGQLGNRHEPWGRGIQSAVPLQVDLPGAATAITVGDWSVCALVDGAVSAESGAYCWGSGRYGMLGAGGSDSHHEPARVRLPD